MDGLLDPLASDPSALRQMLSSKCGPRERGLPFPDEDAAYEALDGAELVSILKMKARPPGYFT